MRILHDMLLEMAANKNSMRLLIVKDPFDTLRSENEVRVASPQCL